MKFYQILPSFLFLVAVSSCTPGASGDTELSEAEKQQRDSVSKAEQRKRVDSLKQTNPILIMPPDSTYTGDYVDKYPNGVIKFKGNFRFGQRHGHWMAFYPNGLQWSELHFDKGLRHGPNLAYREDGSLVYSGFYKNDQKDSLWCYYDTLGVMVHKIVFKNNRFVQELPLK